MPIYKKRRGANGILHNTSLSQKLNVKVRFTVALVPVRAITCVLSPLIPWITPRSFVSTVLAMSGLNLNAITENASRLGMRLQETFSEHTRDLAIAKSPGLSYFDSTEDKLKNIRKQLESNSDREKLDAMKRLVAVRTFAAERSRFTAMTGMAF